MTEFCETCGKPLYEYGIDARACCSGHWGKHTCPKCGEELE